jgi:hypothetical protein
MFTFFGCFYMNLRLYSSNSSQMIGSFPEQQLESPNKWAENT